MAPHPFDSLSPSEIKLAAEVTKSSFSEQECLFRVITLQEPPKREMILFLNLSHSNAESTPTPPARIAKVHVHVGSVFHELSIDLGKEAIVSDEVVEGRHPHIDPDFMRRVELACLAHPNVQGMIASLKLPEGATVVVEPWAYGTDGMNDMSKRLTMCWFYMRLSADPDANYYAYPLDIVAEMDAAMKLIKVYTLPGTDTAAGASEFDRRKIHTTSEYHPNLVTDRRTTTKPYHVSQPEGPSFVVNGNEITWEKWTMHVGFNYREGMTLHNVRYDGRSLFYRLSLAEMFVPYGDPRTPYPRKAAFDIGNDGAGVCANNLGLGCDCLGHIKYFDGWLTTQSGLPMRMPNVICCHEIDDGILWKHTNPRTANAVVTRSRVLVLQTIITVTNYEYIFLFHFSQDAGITYSVHATGILSTVPTPLSTSQRWGTHVAPGVLAPYHQHLFCLRIDTALDGHANSLAVEESHPFSPPDLDSSEAAAAAQTPFGGGVGYTTVTKIVEHETGLDLDHSVNRTFKIINESAVNPITGTPVGYKLAPWYSQLLLAHPSSLHARRAEFAAHAVWVTRYDDGELFPAGKWTMQSLGGEGIRSWIESRRRLSQSKSKDGGGIKGAAEITGVRDADIVVWHTFGSTHNPRIEDWPVMPVEKMVVGLRPVNFFERNPALDVEVATQERSCSVLVVG